jgi:hypothetical protein
MANVLERKVFMLQCYAVISTLLFGALFLTGFTNNTPRQKFDEIDVERINIVEKDGKLRLVIANNDNSPAQVMSGKTYGETGGRPGFIFYNDEGDECGGLGISGSQKEGKVNAFGGLMFDQYKQDQVVALQYNDEAGHRQTGLTILDRPDVALSDVIEQQSIIEKMPHGLSRDSALKRLVEYQGGVAYGAPRLFVGRNVNKQAVVNLSDKHGRTRLQLSVDSSGTAHIDFLDEKGKVTYSVPDRKKNK